MSQRKKRPIEIAGEALYGPAWQEVLAEALGVSRKTVWRWKNGATVPSGVWTDIETLAEQRRDEMKRIAAYAREQQRDA